MRLKETLTQTQIIDLMNGQPVGVFPFIILSEDNYYDKLPDLCLGYYFNRSGEKTISPTYEKFINIIAENPDITSTAESVVGRLIRSKFIEKWDRIYTALITEQYNPLFNYDHTEHKEADNGESVDYGSNISKTANNSDTKTYDTNVEDNGKVATKEVITRDASNSNDIYGFNSTLPIGDNISTDNATETTVGNADDNTTHNTQQKTGTEATEFNRDESESKTGTDTTSYTVNEDITKRGRNEAAYSLIEGELNLRNTQIFFDIIYSDIDSILTLPIYI